MRVAIVGLGIMGRNHLRVLNAMDNIKEILVYDSQPIHGHLGSKVRCVTDLAEIKSEKPEYVVIATPSMTHLDVCLSFKEHDFPILVEKPHTDNFIGEQALLEFDSRRGGSTYVGLLERFNGVYQKSKEILERGRIGTPLFVKTERVSPNPARIKDVGVLLDLGIHDIDLVQWLFGNPFTQYSISHSAAEKKWTEGTTALGVGKFADGCLVENLMSWDSPTKRRRMTIFGDEGQLSCDGISGRVTLTRMADTSSDWEGLQQTRGYFDYTEEVIAVPLREPLVMEHLAMQGAIRGEANDLASLTQASLHMAPVWSAINHLEKEEVVGGKTEN